MYDGGGWGGLEDLSGFSASAELSVTLAVSGD